MGFGGETVILGAPWGICAVLKGFSCLAELFFLTPPAMLPEAAVSRVNLGQFKESLSEVWRMMNVETITGVVPRSCLKPEVSHVNFCSNNPDDMSNIAIVS